MSAKTDGLRVAFLTLGCKVNYYETEKMAEQFRQYGFIVTPFEKKADIYIINTCTVTNIADRKSRQMIHRARKKNPESIVVAVGCYVESGRDRLLEDLAVDAAYLNEEKSTVAEQVIKRFHLVENLPDTAGKVEGYSGLERTRAYVKIQDGCNQFCTYCLIPYVRGGGRLSSTAPGEVKEQVEKLAKKRIQEVVLTGIHLSSYGIDWSEENDFVKLQGRPLLEVLRVISEIQGIQRIRLGSLEPRIISEYFLEELVKLTKICPHFHLSLQSGCDSVLRRMNRHYTTVEYKDKVHLIRKYYSHPAITTDVIVGFPGESEEEFQKTREYLQELKLADIHVFKYSSRTGTRAADMEGQIRPDIKNRRSEILLRDVQGYRKAYGDYFLGRREQVLFEETVVENGKHYLAGHNERYIKIGMLSDEAEKYGYQENEIHTVTVDTILEK